MACAATSPPASPSATWVDEPGGACGGAGDCAAGARLVVAEIHQKVGNRKKFFVSVFS
jgi:hypothetical protein